MTELTNLLTSFARDAAWQSTAALAIGLIVARYFVRQPARAHAVLVLTFIAAVAAPAASQLVRHRGWGVLAPEAAATANQPAANRVETATVPAGADEPIAFSAQENRARFEPLDESREMAGRQARRRSTATSGWPARAGWRRGRGASGRVARLGQLARRINSPGPRGVGGRVARGGLAGGQLAGGRAAGARRMGRYPPVRARRGPVARRPWPRHLEQRKPASASSGWRSTPTSRTRSAAR